MTQGKPDLVTARWLGGPVTIPVLGVNAEYGKEIAGVPRGEAEESANWEIVSKSKAKTEPKDDA